jgi:hypothetical protein
MSNFFFHPDLKMKVLVAATALLLAQVVHGDPEMLPCNRAMTKGETIMTVAVVESPSDSVKFHDHNTMPMKTLDCNSNVPCFAKLAFELSTGPSTAEYIIEAVATAGTSSSWGIKGGICEGATRVVSTPGGDPMDMTYTVPASGSVTVRVAWAKANGQVSVTPDCTCAVTCSTTTAGAPTPHTPAAPIFTH